ncbi:tannase/feruloyl esterase family alpha/beta hydrolase [Caballeronia sp. SEWSISQ10-4 2]|nr:tannase/feruloyl esterase family alpha/beta hydrolase [Caballeronia sp. SEWSISQ10-4 2]
MTHSGTGPGAPLADRLTALDNWVENGVVPPDQLTASQSCGGRQRRPDTPDVPLTRLAEVQRQRRRRFSIELYLRDVVGT